MPRWKQASVALTATILAVAWVSPASAGQQSDRYQQLATEILREMVESPSVSTATDETAALL